MKTYLDSGVLIAAWKAWEPLHKKARAIIEDESRDLITSSLVMLETLAQAQFHKNSAEVEFYQIYLDAIAKERAELDEQLVSSAAEIVRKTRTAGIDALHLAAALRLGGDEFITTERTSSPMFQVPGIRVVNLGDWIPG